MVRTEQVSDTTIPSVLFHYGFLHDRGVFGLKVDDIAHLPLSLKFYLYVLTCTRPDTLRQTYTHTHTDRHAYIHIYTHANTLTHTHTYKHGLSLSLSLCLSLSLYLSLLLSLSLSDRKSVV